LGRMRPKPADAVDHFASLERRISNVESSRRMGFTSFDTGFIKMVGALTEIRMVPEDFNELAGFISMFAFYYGTDNGGAALQVDAEREVAGNLYQEGGKLLLHTNGAVLSYFKEFSGEQEAYFWLGAWGAETIEIRGLFPEIQTDNRQAVLAGSSDVSAGFSSFTYTYAAAFVTSAIPVVTLLSSAVVTWNLTAQSSSSWTMSWTGTTAKTLNYWNFRGE
jgi:hypothetical protein